MSGDGMESMVSALTNATTGITSTTLWGEAVHAVPLIVGIFIFAFGYRIVRKVLKGGYKGKVNV